MSLRRRRTLQACAAAALWPAARAQGASPTTPPAAPPGASRLRLALGTTESGFDPARIIDTATRQIIGMIFEPPLAVDVNSATLRLIPLTAAELPRYGSEHRSLTLRLRPGIFFADDPAFGGKPRELVAEDYAYSVKRYFDPQLKSPGLFALEGAGILGLDALRQAATKSGRFDYDAPVDGLRVLDRYTLEFRFATPQPRFANEMVVAGSFAALAREVVEAYGEDLPAHPVGTGPYRLVQWRRASRIVLERRTQYRREVPAPPSVERIELDVVEESQPRWLAFLRGEHDLAIPVPADFGAMAAPSGTIAPFLRRKGMQLSRTPLPALAFTYFNLEDPVVGGYTPQAVALRRAISLCFDVQREITLVRHGQAIAAKGPLPPMVFGHDPRSYAATAYDPARARALLDMHGYIDRDGDGWREDPQGHPLVLQYATFTDSTSRLMTELWQRCLGAVGIRLVQRAASVQEQLKAARAGRLQMLTLTLSGGSPDGDIFLAAAYGPNKGKLNFSRMDLPAFNRLYEEQRSLPDGPERQAVMVRAAQLMLVYMPCKLHVHPIVTDLAQPWVQGFRRHPFAGDFWRYLQLPTDRHHSRS